MNIVFCAPLTFRPLSRGVHSNFSGAYNSCITTDFLNVPEHSSTITMKADLDPLSTVSETKEVNFLPESAVLPLLQSIGGKRTVR